jgi:hypothetical protein
MTPMVRLKTRLKRMEANVPQMQPQLPNLSYLTGKELDRLCDISNMNSNYDPTLMHEFTTMAAKCPPLKKGDRFEFRPIFPQSLIRYWRELSWKDPNLPRGRYNSFKMTYNAHDRLQELSAKYGWDPQSEDTSEIADLKDWSDEDYQELIELLSSSFQK